MDAPELRDAAPPEGGIDFTRLREIRQELTRLARGVKDFGYYANDMSLGFIPALTFNIFNMIYPVGGIGTITANQSWAHLLGLHLVEHWLKLFPQHNIHAINQFAAIAFGMPVVLLLIRYGYSLLGSRGAQERLKVKLEQSRVLSRFIEGWEELPDISLYVNRVFGHMYKWPTPTRTKPTPIQRQVRIFVNNIDWYAAPPRQLVRWQWFNYLVRIISGIVCLGAQFAVIGTGSAFNQPPPPAWFISVLIMLGSGAIFVLTCVISTLVPDLSLAARARIVLNKLKPVFELLGPEHGGR
jgi:hypothetical protein